MCSNGDASDVWDERIVVARKVHRCDQCRLAIPVGCRHVRIGSLFEGSWETLRVHVECDAVADFVRTKICEAHGEHGFIPIGYLGEEIGSLTSEYGETKLSDDDCADCVALGLEVEEWDEGDWRGSLTNVCQWVWGLAKAAYPAVERRSA